MSISFSLRDTETSGQCSWRCQHHEKREAWRAVSEQRTQLNIQCVWSKALTQKVDISQTTGKTSIKLVIHQQKCSNVGSLFLSHSGCTSSWETRGRPAEILVTTSPLLRIWKFLKIQELKQFYVEEDTTAAQLTFTGAWHAEFFCFPLFS